MHARTLITSLVLIFVLAACGSEDKPPAAPGDNSEKAVQEAIDESTTDSDGDGTLDLYDAEPDVAERTREEPNADGEYELKCDYELGDFGDSGDPTQGFRFIAGGTLRNVGNVGIRVRVTYSWKRLGQDALVVQKNYRLRRGENRDVNLTQPASSDDIDAHQSADGDCSAKATIESSFGQPPYE